MTSEYWVMPVLTLLIGIISLFTDPRDRARKWLVRFLVLALVLSSTGEIYFKTASKKNAELDIAWGKSRIQELVDILKSFRSEVSDQFTNIAGVLSEFGWLNERAQSANVEEIRRSFGANRELAMLAASTYPDRRKNITIWYFPKNVDQTKVSRALEELGFKLEIVKPIVTDVPTNAIWFGQAVSTDDTKLVALTLMRAGVGIKAIRPSRFTGGVRDSLIQVGADVRLVNTAPLSVEDVSLASDFDI